MDSPSERFLSNTGGADVSIRTLGSHLSYRHNPRPRGQKISQATGIGNSIIIIDAEAALSETAFRWRNAAPRRPCSIATRLLNSPHESSRHHSFRRSRGSRIAADAGRASRTGTGAGQGGRGRHEL